MTRDFLWQPLLTIKGVSGQSVVQPANEWLWNRGAREVAVRVEVLNLSGGPTLQLQTGPSAGGPWTGVGSFGLGKSTVVLSAEPNAADQIEEYLRWRIQQAGSDWSVTFQITTGGQANRPPVRETEAVTATFADQPGALVATGASRLANRPISSATGEAPSVKLELSRAGGGDLNLNSIVPPSNFTLGLTGGAEGWKERNND